MHEKIKIKCKCGKIYSVPTDLAGKNARCNECGRVFRIPLKNGEIPQERRILHDRRVTDRRTTFEDSGQDKSKQPKGGYKEKRIHKSRKGERRKLYNLPNLNREDYRTTTSEYILKNILNNPNMPNSIESKSRMASILFQSVNGDIDVCHYCGKRRVHPLASYKINMSMFVGETANTRTYNRVSVKIPRCPFCASVHRKQNTITTLSTIAGFILGLLVSVLYLGENAGKMGVLVIAVTLFGGICAYGTCRAIHYYSKPKGVSDKKKHPFIYSLKRLGFK